MSFYCLNLRKKSLWWCICRNSPFLLKKQIFCSRKCYRRKLTLQNVFFNSCKHVHGFYSHNLLYHKYTRFRYLQTIIDRTLYQGLHTNVSNFVGKSFTFSPYSAQCSSILICKRDFAGSSLRWMPKRVGLVALKICGVVEGYQWSVCNWKTTWKYSWREQNFFSSPGFYLVLMWPKLLSCL